MAAFRLLGSAGGGGWRWDRVAAGRGIAFVGNGAGWGGSGDIGYLGGFGCRLATAAVDFRAFGEDGFGNCDRGDHFGFLAV